MNRRAFLMALVVAAFGAVLLAVYLNRFEQEASGGGKVKLLMVVKPIERGKPITEDVLSVREVPLAYVEDRAVKAAEKDKIIGLRVANNIQAQSTIFWSDFSAAADEVRDLSSLVQPGNRAVAIRLPADDTSLSLIRPGDYVDVLGVIGESHMSEKKSAVVLLQRVLILAAGLETTNERDPRDRAKTRSPVLTLSLSLENSQLLAIAADKGRLSVALRNPEDQRTVEKIPDYASSTLLDKAPKDTAPAVVKPDRPIPVRSQR